ncbi:VOC family protein [Amycolatopsis sp. VS8301801F10]|uniref:VOC family protein n=1 Tax=Amycolatopsis sp. VS8301801F10 TaxID=2652442 RepID=UPI0038FC1B65
MIKRIIAYSEGSDNTATRDFYVHVLGLDVAMDDPVLGFRSRDDPAAQVLVLPPGSTDPVPRWGVDLGEPEAVERAHAEAVRRGLRVVYPLTDEPWGVRRFFVEDPGGTVVNVLAHVTGSSRTE